MLSTYAAQGTPVTIVLQNRSRATGRVRAFDSYVIILDGQKSEIVYRHAVSSIFAAPRVAEARATSPRPAQVKQVVRPSKQVSPAANRQKKERSAPRPAAAAADPGLNTAMKEGLLRWMQEQKSK
jgi:RNA chaperone Hfq